MSQGQPYIYRSLDASRRGISLVKILNLDEILFVTETIESDVELHGDPGRVRAIEANIPIRCAINQVSLNDGPVYAALSYSWGDASNKRGVVTQSSGRKYFVSQRGYMGVATSATSPGDVIAIILGLDTPLVLRALEKDRYRVVGEAYVHGIMDGKAMDDSSVQEFKIC